VVEDEHARGEGGSTWAFRMAWSNPTWAGARGRYCEAQAAADKHGGFAEADHRAGKVRRWWSGSLRPGGGREAASLKFEGAEEGAPVVPTAEGSWPRRAGFAIVKVSRPVRPERSGETGDRED
jgi:hypothetical protein